jgi:hypothetical protein
MGAVLPDVKNPLVFGPEAMIADLVPQIGQRTPGKTWAGAQASQRRTPQRISRMGTCYLECRRLLARTRFLWTLVTASRLLSESDATFVAAS